MICSEEQYQSVINKKFDSKLFYCDDFCKLLIENFLNLARGLIINADFLAREQSLEIGKPIKFSYKELERCQALLKEGVKILNNYSDVKSGCIDQYFWYEKKIPLGNVLAFTTFSSPYTCLLHKMIASLICGIN